LRNPWQGAFALLIARTENSWPGIGTLKRGRPWAHGGKWRNLKNIIGIYLMRLILNNKMILLQYSCLNFA